MILPCGCKYGNVWQEGGSVCFGPTLCDEHYGKPMETWPVEIRKYYDLDRFLEEDNADASRGECGTLEHEE